MNCVLWMIQDRWQETILMPSITTYVIKTTILDGSTRHKI
jgi:hypothetical protein